MRRQIDRVLKITARTAMAVWFRDVQTVGIERVPAAGPVLVVASHFNGVLDPALVVMTTPRVPRFLAAAALWRNPVLARVLDLTGTLPVRRQKEGATDGNDSVFAACHEALARGNVVALFPEGVTHDEPRLVPLRTGAARIALGALQEGAKGLCIVPIGLVYAAKARPRSSALVRVGEPIPLERWLDEVGEPSATPDDIEVVRGLTAELRQRLAEAALDFDDADMALVASEAARVALRPMGASREWEPPLDELERCARAIVNAPPQRQLAVVEAFMPYHDALALLHLTDAALVAGDLTPAEVRWHVGRLAAVAALLPAAAVGAAVNVPAVAAVWGAGRLRWSTPMRGTARLLGGFLGLVGSWLTLRWELGRRGTPRPTLATLLAGPGCGLVALGLSERLRALGTGRESYRRLRAHSAVLPALHEERAELVAAVTAAVEAAEAGDASPPAGPGSHRRKDTRRGADHDPSPT